MSFAARMNPSLSFLVIPLLNKNSLSEGNFDIFLCGYRLTLVATATTKLYNCGELLFSIFMIRLRSLTRRLDPLLQFRRHASTKASHSDITSFLSHASSTKLSPKSTYYV